MPEPSSFLVACHLRVEFGWRNPVAGAIGRTPLALTRGATLLYFSPER